MGKLVLHHYVLYNARDKPLCWIRERPSHQILQSVLLRQLALDVSDSFARQIGVGSERGLT
jgi:hypothetical protein